MNYQRTTNESTYYYVQYTILCRDFKLKIVKEFVDIQIKQLYENKSDQNTS